MLEFGICCGIVLRTSMKLGTLKKEIFLNSCIDLPQDNFNEGWIVLNVAADS